MPSTRRNHWRAPQLLTAAKRDQARFVSSMISCGSTAIETQPSTRACWQPADALSPILPGMAYACLPCSSTAILAVIIAPLRLAASTTSNEDDSPETILFLRGKYSGLGDRLHENSLSTTPPSCTTALNKDTCSGGYTMLNPEPSTTAVFPLDVSAALWAAPSIPLAPPETTASPCSENAVVKVVAC